MIAWSSSGWAGQGLGFSTLARRLRLPSAARVPKPQARASTPPQSPQRAAGVQPQRVTAAAAAAGAERHTRPGCAVPWQTLRLPPQLRGGWVSPFRCPGGGCGEGRLRGAGARAREGAARQCRPVPRPLAAGWRRCTWCTRRRRTGGSPCASTRCSLPPGPWARSRPSRRAPTPTSSACEWPGGGGGGWGVGGRGNGPSRRRHAPPVPPAPNAHGLPPSQV